MIAELTLALLLFTDTTHFHLCKLLRETSLPARLLGIRMPLTILAGIAVGWIGGWLVGEAGKREWIEPSFNQDYWPWLWPVMAAPGWSAETVPCMRWYAKQIEGLDEGAPELPDIVPIPLD